MDNELNTLEITGEAPPVEAIEQPPAEEAPPAEEKPAEDAPPQPDDAPDPAALQADIEKLKKQREKAEADAKYWRQEKARRRAEYFRDRQPEPQPAQATPPAAEAPPQPQQDDFDDYNDFVRAEAQWQADRAAEARIRAWEKEQTDRAQNQAYQHKMESLQEKINAGYERFDDFEEVALDQTVPITAVVMDVLSECEDPAGVAYHLGKNRAEAVQISRMTPIAAARAIAKIESELAAQTAAPPKKTVSSAPPPVRPVSGGGSTSPTKDPDKMTQAEFEAMRNEQGARPY